MFTYRTASHPDSAGFGIVSDRFLFVGDTSVGGDLALALWQVMTTPDAVFEDVLTAIAQRGVENLPAFALIELVDARTSAIAFAVRGRAAVAVHTPERATYSGEGAGTWVEGSAERVSRMAIGLGSAETSASALPLARGVVRTDLIHLGPLDAQPLVAPSGAQVAAAPDDAGILATTAVDRSLLDDLVGAALASADPADDDLGEETILGGVRRRSGLLTPADEAPRRIRYVLRMGPTRAIALDRPVVLGRAPHAEHHPTARNETLPSPRKEVSSSHLEVRLDETELVVRDLDSTNGTIIRRPDGTAELLRGGARMRVPLGTVLDIGDGNVATFDTA